MAPRSQSAISKARRERERRELAARIKEIAREMFVRDGYEAVTLHKIATALEYTRPFIYRYFKDKDELLRAIVLEDMEDLHAELLECAGIRDPLERLMVMARRNTEWAVAHPNHYLLFYSRAWREQEVAARSEEAVPLQQEPLYLLLETLSLMMKKGMFREEHTDPSLVARTLWAGMHGVIMLELTMSGYDQSLIRDSKRPVLDSLDTMMNGLMKGLLKVRNSAKMNGLKRI